MQENGIGGHHRGYEGRTDDWITPRAIIEALGPFDLDPCACKPQPWPTANRMLTVDDDGLAATWSGRVWLNPPYGPRASEWIGKLAAHGNGVALIFARTETRMFFESVWQHAAAVLFIEGRLHFHYPSGERAKANSGAPSVLIAYGECNAIALWRSGIPGHFVSLTTSHLPLATTENG